MYWGDFMENVACKDSYFETLYETMWPKIYNFIYFKVQNIEEAQELTQDVFHKVYKQLLVSSIDESKMQAYIYAAARNIVNDLWRKKYRNPKIVYLDEITEMEEKTERLPSEDIIIIKESLNKLSKDEKEILVLRIVEGYSIDETSKMLNRPQGTVKSNQYRALQKLKKILEECNYFSD